MKTPRIVGRPDGWTPITELEHFMQCPVCGEMFDMRRLDQALAHWHDGPDHLAKKYNPTFEAE